MLLDELPAELLLEVHLHALNESLVVVNRYTLSVFSETQTSYRAQYLLLKFNNLRFQTRPLAHFISFSLKFRLCSEDVLSTLFGRLQEDKTLSVTKSHHDGAVTLPRRLFKDLAPKAKEQSYTDADEPLPYLLRIASLITSSRFNFTLNVNDNEGYALNRALHASHIPLIRFLLSHDANPSLKGALAVRIAIRKRNLSLVTMLIEREDGDDDDVGGSHPSHPSGTDRRKRNSYKKRRRIMDRVDVTTAMLGQAVEVDARDIVEYLMDKGARPDMQTIQRMQRSNLA